MKTNTEKLSPIGIVFIEKDWLNLQQNLKRKSMRQSRKGLSKFLRSTVIACSEESFHSK